MHIFVKIPSNKKPITYLNPEKIPHCALPSPEINGIQERLNLPQQLRRILLMDNCKVLKLLG